MFSCSRLSAKTFKRIGQDIQIYFARIRASTMRRLIAIPASLNERYCNLSIKLLYDKKQVLCVAHTRTKERYLSLSLSHLPVIISVLTHILDTSVL